jgi:hypothetical protein
MRLPPTVFELLVIHHLPLHAATCSHSGFEQKSLASTPIHSVYTPVRYARRYAATHNCGHRGDCASWTRGPHTPHWR